MDVSPVNPLHRHLQGDVWREPQAKRGVGTESGLYAALQQRLAVARQQAFRTGPVATEPASGR
jgi:hypothetical protein